MPSKTTTTIIVDEKKGSDEEEFNNSNNNNKAIEDEDDDDEELNNNNNTAEDEDDDDKEFNINKAVKNEDDDDDDFGNNKTGKDGYDDEKINNILDPKEKAKVQPRLWMRNYRLKRKNYTLDILQTQCKDNMPWLQEDKKPNFDSFTVSQMTFATRYTAMLNEVLSLEDQNEHNNKVEFFTKWTFTIELQHRWNNKCIAHPKLG